MAKIKNNGYLKIDDGLGMKMFQILMDFVIAALAIFVASTTKEALWVFQMN